MFACRVLGGIGACLAMALFVGNRVLAQQLPEGGAPIAGIASVRSTRSVQSCKAPISSALPLFGEPAGPDRPSGEGGQCGCLEEDQWCGRADCTFGGCCPRGCGGCCGGRCGSLGGDGFGV